VDADPRLVSVVLDNLVGNAWKFTGSKPEGLIEFGAVASAEGAFFILDNGAGFDMAYAERLFRPFERLHGHDEFPGTGVGLALVKRIVDRHGGYVRIDSSEGKGTMVVCSFQSSDMG
ncbi:MAG TPA: sensor histidine kinase, partial [Geobacter sulfurreducens]|nr:sensor histidine kinase [Geobacter sulfurreducens]